jgi:hypothetical protein
VSEELGSNFFRFSSPLSDDFFLLVSANVIVTLIF